MGDLNVKSVSNKKEVQEFSQHLINDVKALEQMLENNWFETDTIRIGAEQELCLVDQHLRPSSVSMELLEKANNPDYVNEIAQYNLEINFNPHVFEKNCLSLLEKDITHHLGIVRGIANELGSDIVLAGILPTIRKFDLALENLTPYERYRALLDAIGKLRGKEYDLKINGIDELAIKLDSAFIEGCNTGFQVHLQVTPDDFVSKYNISQAVAAPVLGIAANSPILFGKRLWKETRIALFQQSIDTRTSSDHLRERSPRVTFGNDWLRGSILEIYREDIMRFRVLLHSAVDENSLDLIAKKKIPKLKALTTHNSTVYRWNRPCYGHQGTKPHLRIENRILPAGPTPLDEMANAAFWLGLMNKVDDVYGDVSKIMDFDDARSNFLSAARNGLDTRFNWFGKKKYHSTDLIKEELIPIAKEGLKKAKIDQADIDRYIGVIQERAETNKTGSQWMLHSFSKLREKTGREEAFTAITAAMVQKQNTGLPVHQWDLAEITDIVNWTPSNLLVEEFMTADVFTVQKDDLLEMVTEMMDWRNLRNVPVEDDKGKLVGLVTQRLILRHLLKNGKRPNDLVKNIMIKEPVNISPDDNIQKAIILMDEHKISCLPVTKDKKLVGIITDSNFMDISKSLLKRLT
ncbi:MAG: CBS domain-containing protein [Bacteroidia bacterium]